MNERQQFSTFLRVKLANITRGLRSGTDALVAYRRGICTECDIDGKVVKENGTIKCPACGCKDPALYRPRCPVSKW